MSERWKDIPGYEGIYQASTYGRIKSLAREIVAPTRYVSRWQNRHRSLDRVMTPKIQNSRALIALWQKGLRQTFRIERIIWETFKGEIPQGYQVIKKHKDPTNNKLSNLMLAEIEVGVS